MQDAPLIEYVHDMFVRNDTIYASCGNQGLYIIKLTSANQFQLLNSFSNYPQSGYNHSSWITKDGKTLVFADEVPAALDAKVLDISNVLNITPKNTFRSNDGATAHNPYVVGNKWCWMSSYQDGLYLYDISNPLETSAHGFFDTHPQHGVNDNFATNAYKGNWGAYPYLPSKIIIATDMQNGIFILDGDYDYKINVGINEQVSGFNNQFDVFPNPSDGIIQLIVSGKKQTDVKVLVTDMLGREIEKITFTQDELLQKIDLNFSYLPAGIYYLNFQSGNKQQTKKISIQH
jgi:hypothetical protein